MADCSTIEVSRTGHCGWCFVYVNWLVFFFFRYFHLCTRSAHFGRTHQQNAIIASQLLFYYIQQFAAVTRTLKTLYASLDRFRCRVHSTSPSILPALLNLTHSLVITINVSFFHVFFFKISFFVVVVAFTVYTKIPIRIHALLISKLELKANQTSNIGAKIFINVQGMQHQIVVVVVVVSVYLYYYFFFCYFSTTCDTFSQRVQLCSPCNEKTIHYNFSTISFHSKTVFHVTIISALRDATKIYNLNYSRCNSLE